MLKITVVDSAHSTTAFTIDSQMAELRMQILLRRAQKGDFATETDVSEELRAECARVDERIARIEAECERKVKSAEARAVKAESELRTMAEIGRRREAELNQRLQVAANVIRRENVTAPIIPLTAPAPTAQEQVEKKEPEVIPGGRKFQGLEID